MTTYILLRSNKESGPFRLDQLLSNGLKPDDLVWVEGQSACWRNPHEIKELKDHINGGQQADPPAASSLNPAPRPTVFVSLPGKKLDPLPDKNPVSQPKMPVPDRSLPLEAELEDTSKEELETKYSVSLDEIKQRYLQSLEKKSRPARHPSLSLHIPPRLKAFGMYAAVFVMGAAIVLLLMRPTNVLPVNTESKRLPGTLELRPAEDVMAAAPEEEEVMLPESYYETTGNSREADPPAPVSVTRREGAISLPTQNPAGDRAVVSGNASREEEPASQTSAEDDQPAASASSVINRSQVSVKTNRYTIAALGGIRDLELTLNNDSEFTLDKVTVQVRYLNPNGNVVKTEEVHFRSIHPSGTQTITMKKTNRGVKVAWEITRIESREAGTVTAGRTEPD